MTTERHREPGGRPSDRADEHHFPTLYRYAQPLRTEGEFVSENAANVLLLAHQPAPRVSGTRINAAMLMIGRGDRELAEMLLGPLAAERKRPRLRNEAANRVR